MSKVRNIIKLYTEGVSKQSIGERTGLPRNSVKKYIRLFLASGKSLEEIEQMNDTDLEQLFLDMVPRNHIEDNPKYKTLKEFFPVMEKALKSRENTKEKLWQQYITEHPDGYRVSQFKDYYLKWLRVRNPVMHIEHKAGEKMYVDYAGQKLEVLDPESEETVPVEVFVAILGASQLTYVEASYSQQKEDFIMSCENALHYFGGVPNAIVTDNLKSAVIKSNRYEPTLNEAFRDFVSHYTMAALPAGPYKPKHKALVEGAVKIIYRTIYGIVKERAYSSLELLNGVIRTALEEHNNRLLTGRPFSRRQLFEDTERHILRPLPERRYELKHRKLVTVMKNNYVCLAEDKHYYSVPYHFIGKKVTLLYSQSEVEVYHRYERIAIHKRNRHLFGHTTVNDHLASQHRYMSDWNPDKFIERAGEIGQETKEYIILLLKTHQHPEQSYRSCQGVLSYAARAGKERLNNACRRALQYGDYSYQTIRVILERGLDRNVDDEQDNNQLLPPHKNIRGKNYYQ
ncbi:MAG: IS21 family transposase [Solirubrobacteraceae bacterium]